MMRKNLVCAAVIGTLLSGWAGRELAAQVTLPEGSAPTALVSEYFPNRM